MVYPVIQEPLDSEDVWQSTKHDYLYLQGIHIMVP